MNILQSKRELAQLPEISDNRLDALRARIKPVATEGGKIWWLNNNEYDPRNQAFNWDKVCTSEAVGLEPIGSVTTLHDFGAPVFFKPSEAEVLACLDELLPPEVLDTVVAYEVDYDGAARVEASYHTANTMLYRKKDHNMKITVDIVVTIHGTSVLLIERAKEPFLDKLVFPGGHLEDSDASCAHAAAREADEEIHLFVDPSELTPLTILDAPGGDPRPGRRVSIVYWVDFSSMDAIKDCQAGSDAKKIHIREVNSLFPDEIGFDHWKVIKMLGEM